MATTSIPVKTPEAVAELGSRQRKLSQRHRTVLLLVDGRRHEEEIRLLAQQAGAPENCFDDLLEMGMIMLPTLSAVPAEDQGPLSMPAVLYELPLTSPDSVLSVLPASLTLQPESHLPDSVLNELPPPDMASLDLVPFEVHDTALEEARAILLRAVRAEAPVAGSLTMMRLRRARSREDLESLLEEVEARIFKPFKGLWASQTMARVRELLATHPPMSMPSA